MSQNFLRKIELFPKTIELIALSKFVLEDVDARRISGDIQDRLTRFSRYYFWWMEKKFWDDSFKFDERNFALFEEAMRLSVELYSLEQNAFFDEIGSNFEEMFEFVDLSKDGFDFYDCSEEEFAILLGEIDVIKYDLGY